jgi:hypothetical protein
VHDTVIVHDAAGGGLFGELAAVLAAADPQRIAINRGTLAVADGLPRRSGPLSEEAVGPRLAARMVSSTPVVAGIAVREAARGGGHHAPGRGAHGPAPGGGPPGPTSVTSRAARSSSETW